MSATLAVLRLLADAPWPLGCADVGVVIRPGRGQVAQPSRGGGDYAAQMLLGRLRKRGLVAHVDTGGSSAWTISPAGRRFLDEAGRFVPAEVQR